MFTIIGPNYTGNPDSTNSNFRRALHLRRNTATSVFNSIFTGYPSAGLLLDGRKTTANYCGDTLQFECNIIAGCKNDWRLSNADTLCITNLAAFEALANAHNDTLNVSNAIDLENPFGNNNTNPDLRPKATSPALTVGSCFDFAGNVFLNVEDEHVVMFSSIYPNPANTLVNVSFQAVSSTDVTVILLDLNGKVLKTIFVPSAFEGINTVQFDIADLSSGVYLVNIQTATSSNIQKLVVR